MKLKSVAVMLFRVVLPVVAGLVVLVAVTAWLTGFFSEKITPGRTEVAGTRAVPLEAATDEVHQITQPYAAEAVGTLRAAARTEVAARMMARIDAVRAKAGDQVEAGDVLVVLDQRDIQARLSQAEAALVAAEAQLRKAQQDYERDVELIREKVIAQNQLDQSTATFNVAKAGAEQARQSVQEAKVMLEHTTIRAPQTGTVVDRLAEPGDIAAPGVPLLVLYDTTSLRLEVPVMENLAGKLKPGDRLTVQIDALNNKQVEATVDEIVPQAQAASRSFLVKLGLPRVDGAFEGMFGRLWIPAGERVHLCLDERAVQTIGQLHFVDVVRDDNSLERRFIKLGRVGMPGRVEVISGLEPGERVLLRRKDPSDVLPARS